MADPARDRLRADPPPDGQSDGGLVELCNDCARITGQSQTEIINETLPWLNLTRERYLRDRAETLLMQLHIHHTTKPDKLAEELAAVAHDVRPMTAFDRLVANATAQDAARAAAAATK